MSGFRLFTPSVYTAMATRRVRKIRPAADAAAGAPAGAPAAPRGPRKYPAVVFTAEQRREMLVGYRAVPRKDWTGLEKGWHVRVEKVDGKFLRGGWIERVVREVDTGEHVMELTAGRSIRFSLRFSDLRAVWAKGEPVVSAAAAEADDRMATLRHMLEELKEKQERTQQILAKIVSRLKLMEKKVGAV